MKNKKKFFLLIIGIALIVFVGLYLIINYNDKNILNSDDKKWINDNGGKVIDIAVINDIPVYANNGSGVIFDFLDFFTTETTLEFNKIPYIGAIVAVAFGIIITLITISILTYYFGNVNFM